jgi:hypothetical protein
MTRKLSNPLTPTNRRDETWHRTAAGRKGKAASPWRFAAADEVAERARRRAEYVARFGVRP